MLETSRTATVKIGPNLHFPPALTTLGIMIDTTPRNALPSHRIS